MRRFISSIQYSAASQTEAPFGGCCSHGVFVSNGIMSSSQLVWQIVKNNNCFIHKGLNGVILSKEPGNLYNVHCYKYSGISNDKAIHIEGDGQGLKVTKLIAKHSNKPSKAKSSSSRKKSFQRVSAGLTKEMDGYRPDLKKAALARASAVNRSSKGSKSAKKE